MRHIVRVPLARMRRHLKRLESIYADLSRCDAARKWIGATLGGDDVETLRNLATAIAHLQGWITYRKKNRRDPTRLKDSNYGA